MKHLYCIQCARADLNDGVHFSSLVKEAQVIYDGKTLCVEHFYDSLKLVEGGYRLDDD